MDVRVHVGRVEWPPREIEPGAIPVRGDTITGPDGERPGYIVMARTWDIDAGVVTLECIPAVGP